MKQIILFAAALIMAVSSNSCTSKEEASTTTNNPSGGWGGNTGGGSGTGDNNTGGNTQSQTTRIIRRIVETQKTEYSDSYGVHTFEYDNQNRITNWTYKSGQTTIAHYYTYSGNKVSCYTIKDYGVYAKETNVCDITLNSDGYAVYIESVDNIDGRDYYDRTDITYQNGYIQTYNLNWDYLGGYDNSDYTWTNGNMTGIYKVFNEDPEFTQEYIVRAQYTYNLSREAVPVNIDLAALVDGLSDSLYEWIASPFFFGRHSKNLLTKIELIHISSGSGAGYGETCTFDYKFNSDDTIATMTADYDGHYSDSVTTFDITYY